MGLALSVLTKIHPKNLWANFVQPMGLCSLLGFIALITYRQRLRMEWKRPIVLASLLLFAAMLPFMVTLHIYERGGYYITLAIPVVLLSCAVLSSSAPVLRRFAPLALLLQVFLTGKAYYEWEIAYPGADWVPILEAELEGQGIIIAQDFPEWRAIHHHTRVTSISAKMPRHADDDMASRGEEVVLHMMRVSRSRNWKVGVTRRFWENDAPLNVQLKRLMREQFGEPQPGRRGEYLLFDSEADSPHD